MLELLEHQVRFMKILVGRRDRCRHRGHDPSSLEHRTSGSTSCTWNTRSWVDQQTDACKNTSPDSTTRHLKQNGRGKKSLLTKFQKSDHSYL